MNCLFFEEMYKLGSALVWGDEEIGIGFKAGIDNFSQETTRPIRVEEGHE
jgi:hypothetical protein